jgi:predicted methyltransferase
MPDRRVPLTHIAHDQLREIIRPGDRVIDATAGNGHDTLFLAECVGPQGRVVAFDIQQAALDATRARLETAGLAERCRLVLAGHEHMSDYVSADWAGGVAVVMFNLGYRPGGDKAVVTRPRTTLAGLAKAVGLLRVGGALSVMIYRGHGGGSDEEAAVEAWLARLPDGYARRVLASPGPVWQRVDRLRHPAPSAGDDRPVAGQRPGRPGNR